MSEDFRLLEKKLKREISARKQAESLLETKSRELYVTNANFRRLNDSLETEVQNRTKELVEANERLLAESEARRQADERFRYVIESAPIAMVMSDGQGKIILANTEARKIYQYELEEIIGKNVDSLVPEKLRAAYKANREQYAKNPVPRQMGSGRELFALRKNGDEFPVEIGLNPVELDGKLFILSAISDITERKRNQAILDETRRELEDLAENSNVPMHWVNQDGIIQWANAAELKLLGYSSDEYIGQPIQKFHVDQSVVEDILGRLMNLEKLSNYEARLRTKSGSEKTVSIHSSVYVKDSVIKHSRCFTTDVTEKKNYEQQLARQARQATILHQITDIAANATSLENALQDTLESICNNINWPLGHVFWLDINQQELVSSGIWYLPGGKEYDEFRRVSEEVRFKKGVGLPGLAMEYETSVWISDVGDDNNYPRNQMIEKLPVRGAFAFPIIWRNKTVAVLEFYSTERIFPDDELKSMIESIATQLAQAIERIEAKKELEGHARQLELSNKELQQFAYVASHDLKSPLRAIFHLAEWISEDEENKLSSQSLEDLNSLQTRANSMSRLLDDLLAYSMVGKKNKVAEVVNIENLIQDIINTIDKPEEFRIDVAENFPEITAPKVPLRLVLQNLIENTIKHHHRLDGNLEIKYRDTDTYLEIELSDDGPGIPSEASEKVFEIFVSLKTNENIESSGMGLALVKKTIESQGGTIELLHRENQIGTTFRLRWPKNNTSLPHTKGNYLI